MPEVWTKLDTLKVGEQFVVYTKDTDLLPVTSTKLEYEPCMKPGEVSISPGQHFYALEIGSKGCSEDKT